MTEIYMYVDGFDIDLLYIVQLQITYTHKKQNCAVHRNNMELKVRIQMTLITVIRTDKGKTCNYVLINYHPNGLTC